MKPLCRPARTAAVVVLLSAAVFCACAQQSADISGKWKTSHNLSDSVNEVVNESKFAQGTENKFDAALYVDRICTIKKQSGSDYYTISAAPDMEKFEKDYKAYIDRYTAWMVEQFYQKSGQNKTRQEFAEQFEAGVGKTPQRAFEESFYATFDADVQESVKSLYSDEYSLFVRDGRLYRNAMTQGGTNGYETFTLDGDMLTITGNFDMDGNAIPPEDGGTYEPTVMTRVTE